MGSARGKCGALSALACVAALGAFAAPALATFHLMKIREVSLGSAAQSRNDSYVELQMYEPGQNHVGGKEIRIYDASGNITLTFIFPTDAINAQSQQTILVGDSAVPGADYLASTLDSAASPAGGAACFLNPTNPPDYRDCVAWGNYSDASQPTHLLVGSPVAPTGIPDGKAITRSIAGGCATLLEDSDDTNDSATDFSIADPDPRSNSTAPTEHTCPPPPTPQTTILSGPRGTTRDRTPTFSFKSSLSGAKFGCKLDSRPFAPCSSPKAYSTKLGFGKHTFRVRATLHGRTDTTPAVANFTIPKPHRH